MRVLCSCASLHCGLLQLAGQGLCSTLETSPIEPTSLKHYSHYRHNRCRAQTDQRLQLQPPKGFDLSTFRTTNGYVTGTKELPKLPGSLHATAETLKSWPWSNETYE